MIQSGLTSRRRGNLGSCLRFGHPFGVQVRAGLHTGEVERCESDIQGIAVHLAARIMDEAAAGEVVVSRRVKDLVAGSDIEFDDTGEHSLKGIEQKWQLFRVRQAA